MSTQAGTKMTLHRYGHVTLDWDSQEILIDEELKNRFVENGNIIPINYPFEPNKRLIEVYYNGQLLHSGGSYEELDQQIKLHVGVDENGQNASLDVGDELFIKVYKNQYCSRGGETVSGADFYELKKEIHDARKFRTYEYSSLSERLEEIQEVLEIVYGGHSSVEIIHQYNSNDQIIREVVEGDYNMVREFSYNDLNEVASETIRLDDGKQVTKSYQYDPVTRRLLRTYVSSAST